MIRYHFDLYPRDDPKDGALLVRFTKLQSAEYRAESNGTGAGKFSIRGDTADAGFIDPAGLQYVRVVREDTVAVTEEVIGGFFLDSGDFSALDKTGTRLLTFGGAGTLSYLAREVLWSRSYNYAADDPIIDSTWHFYNQPSIVGGDFLGAVLYRVTQEAGSFASPVVEVDDKPETAIPDVSTGPSMGIFNDSAGNAWTVPSGEFKAQVGENILTIVKRLMEAGLYIEMNPDTFVLNAWEQVAWPGHTLDSRGQDKSGAAWGLVGGVGTTYIVRFQAPTDGTIATGNVLSDAKRGVAAFTPRSAILAGDNGTYVVETVASTVPWHGYYPNDSQDTDTLTHIADSQIGARSDAGDTLRLRMKHGTDAANGEYLPLSDYDQAGIEPSGVVMLNDLVTVHTGTGQWDYNEDTFPVAALTIVLRPGGDWDAWADLGSTHTSMAERAFQARGISTHSHPPNPELCLFAAAAQQPQIALEASGTSPGGGTALDLDIAAFDATSAIYLIVEGEWVASADADAITAAWQPGYVNPGTPGTSYALTKVVQSGSGTNRRLVMFRLLAPLASTQANSRIDIQLTGQCYGAGFGYWYLTGVNQAAPEAASASSSGTGTVSSVTVAAGASDLVLDGASFYSGNAGYVALTASGGQTLDWTQGWGSVFQHERGAAGHGDATPGWTSSVSYPWLSLAVAVNGGSGVVLNDGHLDLIGTGARASRCGHRHHLLRTTAPTVDDDVNDGYPVTTLWTNTVTNRTYLLTDNTAGAAVWVEVGAGVSAPADATYLTTATHAGLSAEVVVGATPGGELGGTWAAPTVDATHSGSTHSAATDTHIADTSDAHDASAVSVLDTGGYFTGTDVEAALQEIGAGGYAVDALSAKASGSGDVTTTASLADVTGATLSLEAGTYIVVGIFDTLVNNALNDRTFEGHLDVGGVDENDYGQLVAPGLVNVRATIPQSWRIVLASTTTVKLRTLHSGGTVGDFTVKSTNTTLTAYRAGGGASAAVKAYNSTTQSIADATSTPITFDSEEYDSDAFHSIVTNTSRFTIPTGKAGKYRLDGGVTVAAGASPVVAQLWWRADGTTGIRAAATWIPNATAATGATCSTTVTLAAGQYVELMFYQDSSGARNIGSASVEIQSFGSVTLIGT